MYCATTPALSSWLTSVLPLSQQGYGECVSNTGLINVGVLVLLPRMTFKVEWLSQAALQDRKRKATLTHRDKFEAASDGKGQAHCWLTCKWPAKTGRSRNAVSLP